MPSDLRRCPRCGALEASERLDQRESQATFLSGYDRSARLFLVVGVIASLFGSSMGLVDYLRNGFGEPVYLPPRISSWACLGWLSGCVTALVWAFAYRDPEEVGARTDAKS